VRTAADSALVAELPKSTKVGESASETGACPGGIFEVESASTKVGDSELSGGGCTPEDPPPTAIFSLDVEKSLSSGRRGFLRTIKCCGPCRRTPANAVWNWSPVGGGLSDRQRRKVYNIVLSELSKLIRNTHAWLRPGLSWLTQNPVTFIDSRAHCRLPKSGGPFSGRNWEALFMVKGTICPIGWTRSPSRNRSVARSRRNCGRRHSAKW